MNNTRIETIKNALNIALAPTQLDIIDESAFHIGHSGAQNGAGHYKVIIQSAVFIPGKQIENHRLIYQALGTLIPQEIHALKIQIIF